MRVEGEKKKKKKKKRTQKHHSSNGSLVVEAEECGEKTNGRCLTRDLQKRATFYKKNVKN